MITAMNTIFAGHWISWARLLSYIWGIVFWILIWVICLAMNFFHLGLGSVKNISGVEKVFCGCIEIHFAGIFVYISDIGHISPINVCLSQLWSDQIRLLAVGKCDKIYGVYRYSCINNERNQCQVKKIW